MKHTPLPFVVNENSLGIFIDHKATGLPIVRMVVLDRETAINNASFIVCACHSYEELLEELRTLTDHLEMAGDEIYHDINKAKIIHSRKIIAKAEGK
jgi:hypothetical protein